MVMTLVLNVVDVLVWLPLLLVCLHSVLFLDLVPIALGCTAFLPFVAALEVSRSEEWLSVSELRLPKLVIIRRVATGRVMTEATEVVCPLLRAQQASSYAHIQSLLTIVRHKRHGLLVVEERAAVDRRLSVVLRHVAH